MLSERKFNVILNNEVCIIREITKFSYLSLQIMAIVIKDGKSVVLCSLWQGVHSEREKSPFMIHLTLIIFIFHFTCEEHFVVEFYVQSSTCNKIDLLKKSLCGDIRKEVSILVIFYHANVGINIQSSRIDIL